MAVLTEPAGLPLWSDYRSFVRRHRTTIGGLMALGLIIGLAWSWRQPPTYSATASVVLVPVPKYVTPSATALAPSEVTIDTDAQLLRSLRVQTAVGDVLGVSADDAAEHLKVTAAPHTHLLEVTVSAGSPGDAADAADAAVAALVRVRRSTLGALRPTELRQLRLFVVDEEDLLNEQMAIPGYDEQATRVLDLSTALQELEDARREPAVAVSPAVPPRHADHANTEVPVTSGAMVGLLCGCLVGAGRDRAGSSRRAPSRHRSAGDRPAHQPFGVLPRGVTPHEDHHHAY